MQLVTARTGAAPDLYSWSEQVLLRESWQQQPLGLPCWAIALLLPWVVRANLVCQVDLSQLEAGPPGRSSMMQVSHAAGCPQMQLAYAIFQEAGVIKAFGLKESVLAHFIANVATNYHANPYHNLASACLRQL